MGAQNSKAQGGTQSDKTDVKEMKIANVVDYVATKYITQNSFKELTNLHKKEYCNKLVILTSKVIRHFLSDMDIKYLDQRTKKGALINKMDKQKVVYLDKNDLDRLDISSSVRKKRMCIGIAKFYIKIAHLFAAISMTINPRYTYTDSTGVERTVSLSKKGDIPKNLTVKYKKAGLCSSRINALMTQQNNENGIVVKVTNCDMNKKDSHMIDGVSVPYSSTSVKTLFDEPGMPELELLYYDKYNFNEGKYDGMTEQAKKEYAGDLLRFYKAFTGEKKLPVDASGKTNN